MEKRRRERVAGNVATINFPSLQEDDEEIVRNKVGRHYLCWE